MDSRRDFMLAAVSMAAVAPIAALAVPAKRGMRISVDDPGYDARARYDVFLDGVAVKRCFTADEAEGYVVVAAVDEHGCMYLNAAKTDVVSETRYGRVRIQRIA